MINSLFYCQSICTHLRSKQPCIISAIIDCDICGEFIIGLDVLWRKTNTNCHYITLKDK